MVSQQSSTCPSGFPDVCAETGSGFPVGSGYQPVACVAWSNGQCTTYQDVGNLLVGTTNEFFDEYAAVSTVSYLSYYGGGSQCTQTCSQQYYDWCNVAPIMSHTFTYTFQKSTISGTPVTQVTVAE